MKFKELRVMKIVSQIELLSICDTKTGDYNIFTEINNVPVNYDEMVVTKLDLGVLIIDNKFNGVKKCNCSTDTKTGKLIFKKCSEIVLSDE